MINRVRPVRPADQRFRLGLTGLAMVFLLVLGAAVLIRPSDRPTVHTGEPLAKLGVAPGSPQRGRTS